MSIDTCSVILLYNYYTFKTLNSRVSEVAIGISIKYIQCMDTSIPFLNKAPLTQDQYAI